MLSEASLLVAHNGIKFDIPAIKKVFPSWETKAALRDSLLCSRIIWPDIGERDARKRLKQIDYMPGNLVGLHGLKAWGYRLDLHKDEYKGGWEKWSPEMHTYMVRDVAVTVKLWRLIESKQVPENVFDLEHRFAHIIFLQEQHGFGFDVRSAHVLHAQLVKRREALERELQLAFPPWWEGELITPKRDVSYKRPEWGMVPRLGKRGTVLGLQPVCESYTAGCEYTKLELVTFNPGSRHHVANRLKTIRGWKPNRFTADGHAIVDEDTLGSLPFAEAKLLTEYFTIEKRLGALSDGKNAWLRLERNGRIHGEVNTHGTASARCTHSKPNVSQVPSVKNANGKVPYGEECRALFIPTPGYVQVGGDASGIQMRCLAHYLARWDDGEYGRELINGDVHTKNAQAAELPSRDNAKRFIYALILGAGDEKLGSIAEPNASPPRQKNIGKEKRGKLLANIPGLGFLTAAIKKRVDKDASFTAIDGRKLPVRSAHSALSFMLQSAEAIAVKLATVYLYEDLIARGWVFGREWAQVAHVHDEIQAEVLPHLADEYGLALIDAIQRAGRDLGLRVPLTGEYKIGRSWAECH